MIKKIIASNFILIASIIILAHDMVPHHHHDEVEAIVQSYSPDAEKEHHNDFPQHEHQQDDYLYIIRQAFVLSPNLARILDSDPEFTANTWHDFFLINTPSFQIVFSPPDYKIPIWEKHQDIPTTVTYNFGLRAPPSIV